LSHVGASISLRSLVVGLTLAGRCVAAEPTIDGTSDAAFQATHEQLLVSLLAEDQLRFVLAETIYLAPFKCAEHREPLDSELLTKVLGGKISLKACRQELNGKGFKEIMRLAYPPDGKVPAVAPSEPPNKSLERTCEG
jgi:hypothetical protein